MIFTVPPAVAVSWVGAVSLLTALSSSRRYSMVSCTCVMAVMTLTRSTVAMGCPSVTRSALSTRYSVTLTAAGIVISIAFSAVNVPPPKTAVEISRLSASAERMLACGPVSGSSLAAIIGKKASVATTATSSTHATYFFIRFFCCFSMGQPP